MRFPKIHAQKTLSVMASYSPIFVVTVIFFTFCAPSFSADDVGDAPEYIIGRGDVIKIVVWQYEQFNSTATVVPDGKITVNLLGDIAVVGRTRHEVKEDIAGRLTKFIKEDAEITVSIVESNSQRISVFGQVVNPMTITFYSPPSLLDVIMSQCIPTPSADLTAVKVIPRDSSIKKPITVNLIEVLGKGDTSLLPELHPGDMIYVPKIKPKAGEVGEEGPIGSYTQETSPQLPQAGEPFTIHIMGGVAGRASYQFAQEPTLIEALLKAGSVVDSTNLQYIRIVRTGPIDGGRVMDVDIDKFLADGDASRLPRLYHGDIIYVPDLTRDKLKDVSITITGQVVNPGSYKTQEPLDILDAIAMAGGLADNADPENIRIRKENADFYEEKIVNIDEFLSDVGSIYRPEMVGPGYRIYVPKRSRSAFRVASGARSLAVFLTSLITIYSFWRIVAD